MNPASIEQRANLLMVLCASVGSVAFYGAIMSALDEHWWTFVLDVAVATFNVLLIRQQAIIIRMIRRYQERQ